MSKQFACSCGQLTLCYEGIIERTSICHCLACQKRTGSAFGIQARVKKEKLQISGKFSTYTRLGDSGAKISFYFCPQCGSNLFWNHPSMTDSYIVAIGNLDDKDFPAPSFSVYEDYKQSWVILPACIVEHMS